MKTNLCIKEALEYCSSVGCVYPDYGKDYYVNSNLPSGGYWVRCEDGGFYCLDVGMLPLAYHFESPTIDMLCEKSSIIVNSELEESLDLSESLKYFKESDFIGGIS